MAALRCTHAVAHARIPPPPPPPQLFVAGEVAASLTTADAKELQDVLETMDLGDRLRKALLLLKKEQQLSLLQASIKQDVEKRIDKQQRTWFLMEQLKSIKKELGLEKDDKVGEREGGAVQRGVARHSVTSHGVAWHSIT